MATIIFGGSAVIAQTPKVPTYIIENQEQMARQDRGYDSINDTCQVNANRLIETDDHISLVLFVLPEGVLAYDARDEEPTNVDRTSLIALRELRDQLWTVEGTETELHTVRWGFYIFRLMNVDSYKKILKKKAEPEVGLAAALKRGMIL